MQLDLTPLDKALNQLDSTLGHAHSSLAQTDSSLFEALRAGSIQAFEFTYATALKFLSRTLEILSTDTETIKEYSFRDLLRLGNEYDLLRTPHLWFDFREKRNITSHTYDETKAADVYAILPQFLVEATDLRDRIKRRLERDQ